MIYFESLVQTSVDDNTQRAFANTISDLIEILQAEVRNNYGVVQIKETKVNPDNFQAILINSRKSDPKSLFEK